MWRVALPMTRESPTIKAPRVQSKQSLQAQGAGSLNIPSFPGLGNPHLCAIALTRALPHLSAIALTQALPLASLALFDA